MQRSHVLSFKLLRKNLVSDQQQQQQEHAILRICSQYAKWLGPDDSAHRRFRTDWPAWPVEIDLAYAFALIVFLTVAAVSVVATASAKSKAPTLSVGHWPLAIGIEAPQTAGRRTRFRLTVLLSWSVTTDFVGTRYNTRLPVSLFSLLFLNIWVVIHGSIGKYRGPSRVLTLSAWPGRHR